MKENLNILGPLLKGIAANVDGDISMSNTAIINVGAGSYERAVVFSTGRTV